MKQLFQKRPFAGWLVLFILLLCGAMLLNSYELARYQPAELASRIEQDFIKREQAILKDYARHVFFQKDVRINEDSEDPEFYILHVYKHQRTYYWNSNITAVAFDDFLHPERAGTGRIIKSNNGIYYQQYWRPYPQDSTTGAFTLIPIATDYSIQNKYFKSAFVAGNIIPEGTVVADSLQDGAIAIHNAKGVPVFFVRFPGNTLKSHIPGTWLCILFFAAICCLAAWIHKICLAVGRWRHPVHGWLLLVLLLLLIFYLIKWVKFWPFDIRNIELFSPQLLSSGEQIRSLGDLLLYALADSWLMAYLLLNVPFDRIRAFKKKYLNILLAILLSYIVVQDIFVEQVQYMYLLIIDSKIPFEVTDFSNSNIYTFLGLLVFTIVTFNFILLLCIYIKLCKTITNKAFLKYILLIGLWILVVILKEASMLTVYYIAVTVLSLIGIFLLDKLGFPMQPIAYFSELAYSAKAYIWFAVICSWITIEVFYFNYAKEKDLRKVFAQKQEQKQDIVAEFAFSEEQRKIAADSMLHRFLKAPVITERSNVSKHLYYEYLGTSFKKFRTEIYFYDKQKAPILNPDTADKPLIAITDSIRSNENAFSTTLVYLDAAPGGYIYRADIPVTEGADTLGYVGISLSIAQNYRKTTDPLYLRTSYNPTDQQYFDKYSFAIYKNNKLTRESDNARFPYSINEQLAIGDFIFHEQLNQSMLFYRASEEEIICVAYKRRLLINAISLFSYVLGVVVLISIGYVLLRHFIFNPAKGLTLWRNFNLTIRSKVNLTILITVFLSFVILGIITVSYLIARYRENQHKNLQNAIIFVSRSVMKSIEGNATDMSSDQFAAYVQRPEYTYMLNELAEDLNVDINIYGSYGTLKATSQQDFNQKGYLSRLINRDAFEVLSNENRTEYTHIETTGNLKYRSSYIPIRNKQKAVLGFVNIPYYTSQTELSDEISNILAVLVNLYTFIFFLSGISAVLISNNVIRSFNLLINQFKSIRLRYNEPLQWPYKDEIGMLVNEYNAMIQKVEAMATRLANSEREAAWREIARQVAHEIKNPLTPMKLQIQYLQQSIANGRADIGVLTSRVSAVLLEQIEHLSLIASEFSNFAKLPEANPEKIDVTDILQSLTDLYHNKNANTRIILHLPERKISIWIDKSYFIRILSNIVQNAVQAIPEERYGLIEITCIEEGTYALITIQDNGTGISPEIRDKLFLPYFTTKSSGTGLGLSMTKNMVELSNGTISVDTEEGKGTIFFVKLPLAE